MSLSYLYAKVKAIFVAPQYVQIDSPYLIMNVGSQNKIPRPAYSDTEKYKLCHRFYINSL